MPLYYNDAYRGITGYRSFVNIKTQETITRGFTDEQCGFSDYNQIQSIFLYGTGYDEFVAKDNVELFKWLSDFEPPAGFVETEPWDIIHWRRFCRLNEDNVERQYQTSQQQEEARRKAELERPPTGNKEIIVCPTCDQRLFVPSWLGTLQVTCPSCQARWEWPVEITSVPERNSNSATPFIADSNEVVGIPCSDEVNQALLEIASHAGPDTRIAASPDTGIKNPESPVHNQPTPPGNVAEEKVIIACRKCAKDLSVPAGLGPIQVTCPSCRDVWDWPAGRKIITCPACSRQLQVPIVEGIIHVACPSCNVKVEWFGKYANPIGVDIDKIKLSDLTIAGWLLVVMAVTVTGLCGFYITGLVGEPNGAIIGRLKVLALALCAGIPGVVLFFTGKWFLEKKLNIRVIKRSPL